MSRFLMAQQIVPSSPATSAFRTAVKVLEFGRLPAGWAYGQGGAIEPAVISRGLAWIEYIEAIGVKKMNAFPGEEGNLLITSYVDGDIISIDILTDGMVSVLHERAEDELLDRPCVGEAEAFSLVAAAMETACATSASLTRNIGTSKQIASRAQPSRTPQKPEEAEPPSLRRRVYSPAAHRSVPTSPNSTLRVSQESRPYSVWSNKQTSHQLSM